MEGVDISRLVDVEREQRKEGFSVCSAPEAAVGQKGRSC